MTRKMMAMACAIGMLYACSPNEEFSPESNENHSPVFNKNYTPVSQEVINEDILQNLQQHGEFDWKMVSSNHLLSTLLGNDSIVTVGYQPKKSKNIKNRIHEIDVNSKEWVEAKHEILDGLQDILKENGSIESIESRITVTHDVLPYFKLKVHELELVDALREMSTVRYVEPATASFEDMNYDGLRLDSDAGCDVSPAGSIPSADYTTVSPNAKVPWNFYVHNIPQAWSYSTGNNVAVGLIDTGISPNQAKLNSQFASGNSTNRYINKYGTYVSSWWWWADPDGPNDQCGHGTQMAGTISAPRASGGSSVGVAYNADLVAIRGTGDVVINGGSEKDGVSDALVILGNRSDVKIISMSIGDVFSSGQVKDAIRYAHNKGKLIFCAAGTSLTWTSWWGVIFPANMSETVAVTGIKDNGYNRCDVCHNGSKVDFTVTMQRASNTSRTSLTLAMSGDQPSYVGGSSVATATTAGIAALVWAQNPGLSRDQVLQKLKEASEFYPSRNSNYGWGNINALEAVSN